MAYDVTATEDVPITDLSDLDDVPLNLKLRDIDEELNCQNLAISIWYFNRGDEINYHAHSVQEELFYVLDGTFSVNIGRSEDQETVKADDGTFWVAAPMIGHGHRCISEDGGAVLAMGAPAVEDSGLDPHTLDGENIDETLEQYQDESTKG